MQYFKTAQSIPGKGEAWMHIEADDQGTVLRTVTHIPATGEVERIPDPVVKFLFRPERLTASDAAEFLRHWEL